MKTERNMNTKKVFFNHFSLVFENIFVYDIPGSSTFCKYVE